MKSFEIFGRKFFLILIFAIGIYSVFLFLSDINLIVEKFSSFDLKVIPMIMLAVFSSLLVLFVRFNLLLKNHQIYIPLKDSLLIYLAGFTFALSPLKSGEFFKSVLLKRKFDVKQTISVPIIFLERFFDIIGTFVIAMFSIIFLGIDFLPAVFIALIGIFFMFLVIYSKSNFNRLVKILFKFKYLEKFADSLENSYDIMRKSSTIKIVSCSVGLTIFSRLIEAIGAYFVLLGFGIDALSYLSIATTYSASVILGAASMLPGGIGITEGSLAGLMSIQGIEISTALTVAIVIRFCTLWFSIIIGFISLKMSKVY